MRKKNASIEFIKTCYALALIKLMKEKDYNNITISEICKEAGFGRTSYYRYFTNNKDELILFISKLKWGECKNYNPEGAKKDEGKLLLNHVYKNKDLFVLLRKHNLNALIFEIFYDNFGRQKNDNEILSYGKAFFAGAYFGVIYEWIIEGCKDTPDTIQVKFDNGFKYTIEQAQKEKESSKNIV